MTYIILNSNTHDVERSRKLLDQISLLPGQKSYETVKATKSPIVITGEQVGGALDLSLPDPIQKLPT